MRKRHVLAAAGGLVAAAFFAGTVISSALAAPVETTSSDSSSAGGFRTGEYCKVYLDTLASELGVDRGTLGAASKVAMNAVLDAAVADGELEEERATELRDRIAELDDTECEAFRVRLGTGGRGGPGGAGHGWTGIGLRVGEALDAAAGALGVDRDEVTEAFREGTTLEELAEIHGVAYEAVTNAVRSAVASELDDAVADDEITRERAGEILDRIEDWLDDGGEPLHRRAK